MKKAFLIALIASLAITMTACGKVEDETLSKAETTAATAETTVTTTVLEETETTTSTGTSATTSKTSTSATTTAKTSTTKKATTTKKSSNQSSSGGNSNNNYSNNSNNNQSNNNSSGGNSNNNQTTQARTTTQAPMTTTRKPQTTTQAVQTTQAQPQNCLTQSDMDNLKNELQEYSNNIAKPTIVAMIESMKDVLPAGYCWETFLQESYQATPYNSGYDDIDPILYQPNESYMAMSAAMSYNELVNIFKEYIDYEYSERPDAHYVVYIENCPNGKDVDGFYYPPCWVVYLLY